MIVSEILANELAPGDRFHTAAMRWETVTAVSPSEQPWIVSVFTDVTGPGYAWPLSPGEKVQAIRGWRIGTAQVRIEITHFQVRARVATDVSPRTGPVLAEAFHMGRGHGWRIHDHGNGTGLVVTDAPTKAKAISAVRAAAKAHAKALRLAVHMPAEETR